MQVGAVVEDGGADRDADGAAQVAHQVEQARGQLAAAPARSAAQRQRHDRRHGELLADAAQGLRQQQLVRRPSRG